MVTKYILCSLAAFRLTHLSVSCFYLSHHLFFSMLSDVWSLSCFPAKVILVYLTYFFRYSNTIWINYGVFFLCGCFTQKILKTQTFPRISDSGCRLSAHKGMVLLWQSNFTSGSLIVPTPTTDFHNEETSLGGTMNKTWHEEFSLGTKPKDQGWELSLHSLEGVQNRYLSGKRIAGVYCFVREWSAIWRGFSSHSDLIWIRLVAVGSSGCKEKAQVLPMFEQRWMSNSSLDTEFTLGL